MAEACQRCRTSLPEGARFCPACGAQQGEGTGLSREQIICLAAVLIELFALAALGLFVIPRMRDALGGHHSFFTRIVFSDLWVPAFIPPVLILGVFTVTGKKTLVLRMILLSMCMLLGLVPIFGTALGIYVGSFEAVMGDAQGK